MPDWPKPSEVELVAPPPPRRIAPLAKLPVFLDLAGRRVVVAGGSATAAWKAELLAACGAEVEVFARLASDDMRQLLGGGAAAGSLVLIERDWRSDDLDGAAAAVADAADGVEASSFAEAARAAGVPVNVIDRPAFCDFQFGSIVNRSPVVVAVSTDGAAPILGQTIRRRIEALLPRGLGRWAAQARQGRQDLAIRIPDAGRRRRFWGRFSEAALGALGDVEPGATWAGLAADAAAAPPESGQVTLVGAGPGDPDLLTLKAVRALQAADVILFDALVSDQVLDLARREARRLLVGKRGGQRSCRQEDINATMIGLARRGKRVVRLKSGDPMLFGRGGEEIAQLDAAGIPVEVVPGISAAFALAAELGVSLTHRDQAHSLRLVTGHARDGDMPDGLDWRGLCDAQTTLVIYMAGRTAQAIAGRLMAEGRAAATPVAVGVSLGRPERRLAHLTLGELAATVLAVPEGGPVLVGVGEVFAARRREARAPQPVVAAVG